MRVFVTEFRQETNSLTPVTSDMEFWMQNGAMTGDEVPGALRGRACAVGGMIDILEASPEVSEITYGTTMWCGSGGKVEQEVVDFYLGRIEAEITASLPLDLALISFHGALQSTTVDDVEALIAGRVRDLVGEDCVISVSTDLHAWVTAELVETVNVVCGYQTYPHVDFWETGARSASLGIRAAGKQEALALAWVPVPMVVSASTYNTDRGSFSEIMAGAKQRITDGNVLDFTIYQMQPWLDVPNGNSAVVVIAEDKDTAAEHARDLAGQLYAARHEFQPDLHSIDDVIDKAEASTDPGPVILVDSADSCNAGAPGDSMSVAARFLERGSSIRAAVIVNDSPAARRAHEVGVGQRAKFTIGGTRDSQAESVQVDAYVKALHDGVFVQEGPAGRGIVNRIGMTALLTVGTLEIVVCEFMMGSGDPQLYRAFGVEPTLFDLVGVKANTSFRAAYSTFAAEICETDTPGSAAPSVERLNFRRLPRTLYPWTDTATVDLPVRFSPVVSAS